MATTESYEDPGPSSKLVRTFSDHLNSASPKDSLVRGLVAKVSHDREREQRLISLRSQWELFFRDGRQLAQAYDPECSCYEGSCLLCSV